jgi:DNA-directed RNA polymerase I, II, and III subunit RPABC3
MSNTSIVFEDTFEITNLDSERFDHVGRIKAKALTFLAEVEVDLNTSIYPVHQKDRLRIALASSGSSQMETWDGSNASIGSLADEFEYVMYGKVYKKTAGKDEQIILYASFGGLLMSMTAEKADLESCHLDDRVYLLIKKVY